MATLAGKKYGRLRTIASPFRTGYGHFVNVQCSCGVEKRVMVEHLVSGKVKSCGCLAEEVSKLLSQTDEHGNLKLSAGREYKAFHSAQQRCLNPKAHAYAGCGGSGIKFHPEWISDFPNFYRDLGPAQQGQIFIRKDLHSSYSPTNCAWGNWGDFGTALKRRRESKKPTALPLAA
jgi:hypothetical protein